MSDVDPAAAGHFNADVSEPGRNATAGELIRNARQAAGLHIAALAVSLKVPVKKLEALEQDRFDLLPDAVFVRALASSICRALKIDAAQVLERLPQTSAPKLTYQGAGINAPFGSASKPSAPPLGTQVSRPAVFGGVALLIAAALLIFWPPIKDYLAFQPSTLGNTPGAPPAHLHAQTGGGSVNSSNTAGENPPVAGSLSTSAIPVANELSSSPTTDAAVGSLPSTNSAAENASIADLRPNPQAAAAKLLTFSAKDQSWVMVTDGKGATVLRRLLAAGEVVDVSGELPLTAVVGRADATEVQVRGQAFDLAPLAKDNVARFEVK